jgi:tRNA modification GTPase
MSTTTIFALSTPPGRSAIAVVRLSGPGVGAILDAMCPPRPEPRRAVLRRLRDPATRVLLDEALVLHFAAPKSETGEDMAELQLHGGRAIVRAVLDALGAWPGCRAAEPGEFARRAFENGKLDLAQIEGLADLIDAETEAQRTQAMAQATGVQSARFESWRAELITAMGLVEAAIDFSDEGDVSDRAVAQAEIKARELRADLAACLADGHRGEILREGFRVVLAGPPNAGKSSLLNALARREAAIVSAEAGTTRDIVEVRLDLEGLAVIVQDTAGIRETSSHVEQEGIRRSLAAAREADLVVWLSEALSPLPVLNGERARVRGGNVHGAEREIHVLTKCDLLSGDEWIHVKQMSSPADETIHVKHESQKGGGSGEPSPERMTGGSPSREANYDLAISAKTGAGLDTLTALIAARARRATGNPADPALTRARHRREIESAVSHLDTFLADPDRDVELRAEDLRLAGLALGRLTGRIDSEEVLGEIFSRFCIGK